MPALLGSSAIGLFASGCASISGLEDYSPGLAGDQESPGATADGAVSDAASGVDVASFDARGCPLGQCDASDDAPSNSNDAGCATSCAAAFGYSPSNFDPATNAPPQTATTIDCNTTYDSTAHSFTGWCSGQTAPAINSDLTQANGPNIDVLAFRALTVNAGVTLTLTGTNAIVLAVYGDADIEGTVDAGGAAGASGSNTPGASGPGGDYDCGGSTGGDGDTATSNSGGGGGGANTAGGNGANDCPVVATGGAAGSARPDATLKPFYGGCPGGHSGPGGCTSGGAGGGGAVQISAAGALNVDGTISANGGAGGTSSCTALIVGVTYHGGGGGGGGGGAILLEGHTVSVRGVTSVHGGNGGANGGNGATDPSASGTDGTPASCTGSGVAGGGGGGGYGYEKTNTGAAPNYSCSSGGCLDAD
jgi:hypothetical protein